MRELLYFAEWLSTLKKGEYGFNIMTNKEVDLFLMFSGRASHVPIKIALDLPGRQMGITLDLKKHEHFAEISAKMKDGVSSLSGIPNFPLCHKVYFNNNFAAFEMEEGKLYEVFFLEFNRRMQCESVILTEDYILMKSWPNRWQYCGPNTNKKQGVEIKDFPYVNIQNSAVLAQNALRFLSSSNSETLVDKKVLFNFEQDKAIFDGAPHIEIGFDEQKNEFTLTTGNCVKRLSQNGYVYTD